MNPADVGAALVNFNAGAHLVDCIETILDAGIRDIVVVDNGSGDDSLQMVAERFPEVPVVVLPHNPGFGAGMNRAVRELNNDVVMCLNPDAALLPGALATWLTAMEDDPRIAVVGPTLVRPDGAVSSSGRRFPSFTDGVGLGVLDMLSPGAKWGSNYRMVDDGTDSGGDVDWVTGSAMLLRRGAFEEVGGFDESYFMYFEDVDLCRRLHDRGWRIVFEPRVRVLHHGGVSTSQMPRRMLRAHNRSLLRYYRSSTQGLARLALPLVAAGLGLRLLGAMLRPSRDPDRPSTRANTSGQPEVTPSSQ